jgi:hypothetical protein
MCGHVRDRRCKGLALLLAVALDIAAIYSLIANGGAVVWVPIVALAFTVVLMVLLYVSPLTTSSGRNVAVEPAEALMNASTDVLSWKPSNNLCKLDPIQIPSAPFEVEQTPICSIAKEDGIVAAILPHTADSRGGSKGKKTELAILVIFHDNTSILGMGNGLPCMVETTALDGKQVGETAHFQ